MYKDKVFTRQRKFVGREIMVRTVAIKPPLEEEQPLASLGQGKIIFWETPRHFMITGWYKDSHSMGGVTAMGKGLTKAGN